MDKQPPHRDTGCDSSTNPPSAPCLNRGWSNIYTCACQLDMQIQAAVTRSFSWNRPQAGVWLHNTTRVDFWWSKFTNGGGTWRSAKLLLVLIRYDHFFKRKINLVVSLSAFRSWNKTCVQRFLTHINPECISLLFFHMRVEPGPPFPHVLEDFSRSFQRGTKPLPTWSGGNHSS